MQSTQKYYEADAYRTEAAGRILAAEPDGDGGGKIALDGTGFSPAGGGPPTAAPASPISAARQYAPWAHSPPIYPGT